MANLGKLLLLIIVIVAAYLGGVWLGLYGEHEGPGEVTRVPIPREALADRATAQREAASGIAAREAGQILFGDLHVHTTFSTDAFLWSLPMLQGEGAHPIGDACDYARFCSGLDFWSINDHAEASTPLKWRETRELIRQCNAVAGDETDPDVTTFLGYEWSQVGTGPADHYGHRNVIFRDLGDDEVPARPIAAAGVATEGLRRSRGGAPWFLPLLDFPNRQRYYNLFEFQKEVKAVPDCPSGVPSSELPSDCFETAATPQELFEKLGQWGFETMVIPHGTTWGFYTPPGVSFDKQLLGAQHDPQKQYLFEIMSGHGNSEEYRDWRAVEIDASGKVACPEPRPDYLPSCWRAGEIIRGRCRESGAEDAECDRRAAEARQLYAENGVAGHLTVPGEEPEEWLDAGQCRDCYLPAFNYRPGNSAQYALAISSFENDAEPRRFRFGFIASSDNHRARPGTGYKEYDRLRTTEGSGARDEVWRQRLLGEPEAPEASSRPLRPQENVIDMGFRFLEAERQASFFVTGGLAAVHAAGRSRGEIWEALKRREVYGTSGDRILLWFHLKNGESGPVPMGGETRIADTPRFEARAVGAFRQKPGCPEHAAGALGPERLRWLCRGECYHPSDERKLISRIEVIRIRPQAEPGEPVRSRIEDPWKVFPCDPDPAGCAIEFEDPEFSKAARDSVYYVRAIQEASPAVNAGLLRCETDAEGNCVAVRPCYGDYRTDSSDECLAPNEERAWSSPIYVDTLPAG